MTCIRTVFFHLWSCLLTFLAWSRSGKCNYAVVFYDESHNLTLTSTTSIRIEPVVFISGVRGISLKLTGNMFEFKRETNKVWIKNSVLDLYDEHDSLIEADRCNVQYFKNQSIDYFSNFEQRELLIDLNSVSFKRPVCPYLFKNANINTFAMTRYGQTRLYNNKAQFYEMINTGGDDDLGLNATIGELYLGMIYRQTFKRGELSLALFSNVDYIYVNGDMPLFEPDFFVDFKSLRYFLLELNMVGEYFHASTNEWLSHLFMNGTDFESPQEKLNLTQPQTTEQFRTFEMSYNQKIPVRVYYFPDEDFCLFKYFPIKKFVFTQIQMVELNNTSYSNSNSTSCLYRFLAQNNGIIDKFFKMTYLDTPDGAIFNESLLIECKFDERLSICFNSTDPEHLSKLESFVSFYDFEYALKLIEYMGPVITFPIFSALGFFLNLLIIVVIRSKKKQKEKLFVNKSFRLIEMNSAFNCVECFIYMFKMMGLCIGQNSIFCSSLRGTKFQLYFGSMNIYLSETMKSCSMMTGLLFSLQRYIETSKIKSRILLRFSKFSALKLFIFTLFYGFVVSVPVIFNLNLNNAYLDDYDFPGIFWLNKDANEPQQVKVSLYFLHYILNDFAVLLINLVVDCLLVREIKSNLRQKTANKKRMNEQNGVTSPCEQKKKASVERKANNMIILSIIIYLFCRIPELASVFFLYSNPQTQPNTSGSLVAICIMNLFCYLVSDTIEYIYMLSYCFNLFIYYNFNKNFHKGFRQLFGLESKQKL